MMQTGPYYPYGEFDDRSESEYRLAADDKVAFELYPNNGFSLIDAASSGTAINQAGVRQQILIEFDGFMKLPKLGRTYMEGLTIRQAELVLEDKFSEFYNEPFVRLTVQNKRVTIIAGGNSKVVTLTNENTTLFEALASAGGIPKDGLASKVKLIRGDLRTPEVFVLDLSTMDGVKEANLVLQANDIIYIETRVRAIERITEIITPYASLLSSFIVTYSLINTIANR
ncbi:MAG: polysaccharide export outer membrane protein [Bacteroidia bacterium]|jgi:polysaccharide export outer membrane protein